MDKDKLISEIQKNEEDMLDSLKEFQAEALIPLFKEYTKEIIKIVKEAV